MESQPKSWEELEALHMGGMKLPDQHNIKVLHRFLVAQEGGPETVAANYPIIGGLRWQGRGPGVPWMAARRGQSIETQSIGSLIDPAHYLTFPPDATYRIAWAPEGEAPGFELVLEALTRR